jgi:ferritin
MLNEKMIRTLNLQLNEEFYSAYLYLSMSASFETLGLKGFAHWMIIQSQEELAHAMIAYKYINDRMGTISLKPIREPQQAGVSPVELFETARDHEGSVTQKINESLDLAIEIKDHATNAFLQWFVREQVEEEANANEILLKLKIAGDNGNALLLLDNELAQRVFVNPIIGKEPAP